MKTFVLPDLGEGLHEATLVEWYAAPQAQLKQGEPLLAVETAKAIVEIPAPEDLTIQTLLAEPNGVVKVGMPLLSYEAINQSTQTLVTPKSVSVVGELAEASTQASQHSFIIGQQRFSAIDLQQAHANLQAHSKYRSQSASSNEILLTGSRLAMMQQLSAAHQQVALVTLFDEVWVKWPTNTKPLPRLIAALCAACKAEPKLNAWFTNNKLTLHKEVNLGLAVNTAHGLFVPVIHQANLLTQAQLVEQIQKLKQSAQQHQLTPTQLQGATISLSNFGMMAGRFATPMIVPPQVAILGVGKIEQRAGLSKKGNIKTKTLIPLSLSFDHRILTGAEAAHFLAAFITHIKNKGDLSSPLFDNVL